MGLRLADRKRAPCISCPCRTLAPNPALRRHPEYPAGRTEPATGSRLAREATHDGIDSDKRRGKLDDRWLWPELAGLLGVVRPRWVLLENPTGLLAFPEFGEVLGDLASLGFDAEWDAVPAAAIGAPRQRDRVFVVAYARGLAAGRGPGDVAGSSFAEKAKHRNGNGFGMPLDMAVKLWPTPTVHGNYNRVGASKTSRDGLATAVKMWPTPTAVTATGGAALSKWGGAGSRKRLRELVTPQELNGALNPTWVEWLMGFPLGWTALTDWGTPSSRKSRKSGVDSSSVRITEKPHEP